MEFVSGEIYYQAKLSRGLDSDEKLRPLFTFLESDLDSKIQKTQSRIALDRLKNLRRLNSTFYDAAIAHDSTTLQQYYVPDSIFGIEEWIMDTKYHDENVVSRIF